MQKIALEEAMIQPGTIDMVPDHANHPEFKENLAKLIDVNQRRLQLMDESQVELAILSVTTPGLQGLNTTKNVSVIAKSWNSYLVEAVAKHPDRFKAFASIPTLTGEMASNEIQRIANCPEFVGCMINGFDSSGGDIQERYFDGPDYDSMWAALEKHNLPLYLHPRGVLASRHTTYQDYPALKGSAWGFHIETAEHVLRLMLSGVFDRFPKLTIILGHLGEMLPFWAWRIDHRIDMEERMQSLSCKRTVTEYLTNNFYLTTSGYFNTPALSHAIAVMGADRIMFSVDYPYENMQEASSWLESVALSESDLQKIAYGNAQKLLFNSAN